MSTIKNIVSFFILLTIIFCLPTCKTSDFLKQGFVQEETYSTTIPFDRSQGLIVIEVEIKGKTYDFILDTGGMNLISSEIAEELGLSGSSPSTIHDSQGNKTKIDYFTMDKVKIGDIDFKQTGFGIVDFSQLNAVGCFELKGMIGANLMQHAIWELDYEKATLKISNTLSTYDIPTSSTTVPFYTDNLGSPNIDISFYDNIIKKVELDIGSTNSFIFQEAWLDKIQNPTKLKGEGWLSAGLFGYGESKTAQFATVHQVIIQDLKIHPKIASFKPVEQSTIGNQVFQDYRIIFNYPAKEFILIPTQSPAQIPLENYGFKPIFKDKKAHIGFVYEQSSAAAQGLKITDEIIEINGMPTKNISKAAWCEALASFKKMSGEQLSLRVLRAGTPMDFTLEWKKLL